MKAKILSIFLSFSLLAGGAAMPMGFGGKADASQEQKRLEADSKAGAEEQKRDGQEKVMAEKQEITENGEQKKESNEPRTPGEDAQRQSPEQTEIQEKNSKERKMEGNLPDQERNSAQTNQIRNQMKAESGQKMLEAEENASMRSAKNAEVYQATNGYFYIYVRKQGESLDEGHWHILDMSVESPSAAKQQKVKWNMVYLGKMSKSYATKVNEWIRLKGREPSTETDNFSLELEKDTSWEKTRHDGFGTNPVFGELNPGIENMPGFPHTARYYMLCGKFKYKVLGYRMYFDNSVFKDMSGMDIEKENKQIQKKDEKLNPGEASWTGDDYFKFSIDTNNVGMTNYGASGEYHNSIYGFILKPNTYTVKFDANGGTGTMPKQSATYDKNLTLTANEFKRDGYTFSGWNLKKTGGSADSSFKDKQKVKNLTASHNATITLYAQWIPNTLAVKYNANGGSISGNPVHAIAAFANNWNFETPASAPEKYSSFGLSKPGYSIREGAEWNTKADGTGTSFNQGAKYAMTAYAPNLTSGNRNVSLYAQWRPNTLAVSYNANGGTVSGNPSLSIASFKNNWNYLTAESAPEKFASFGLVRTGYERNEGKEWNTKADGTGTSFSQEKKYAMTSYAPSLTTGDKTAILYAQWKPLVFAVTLNHQIPGPTSAGTRTIYQKYDNGWYLDQKCASVLKDRTRTGKISIPEKAGYIFQGYYTSATGGTQMINANGTMTDAGIANYKLASNATWYAQYKYQVSCEDYADIPCDLEKTDGDIREEIGAFISYNTETRQTEVKAGQTGITATLSGNPAGTKVGQFQSKLAGSSAAASSGSSSIACIPIAPQEGAAYQLTVEAGGKTICNRLVYFKDGRFRTIAKLKTREMKEAGYGTSMAGSEWGTAEPSYYLYRYANCTELKNIQAPGTVYRYFFYKDVNMAYSGNGATSGKNILEQGVSLENAYQFRDNEFSKVKTETKKTADKKIYQCNVKYGFQGWDMYANVSFQEKQQEKMNDVYQKAYDKNVIAPHTTEDINSYQRKTPVSQEKFLSLVGKNKGVSATKAGSMEAEYINFLAKWNAFPTIVVTPGKTLEFYEGEDVTKENLTSCLTAHDNEDNTPSMPDLNDKLKIVKISYPKSENNSQAAYEKTYATDVPKDFLLDTYYLKLEKDEVVNVMVTFSVTDSDGQTTEETFPVKIKYNNYPEISSDDIFYYFKEEANKGEITDKSLTGRATAEDVEDGNISNKIGLKDYDPQAIKMQTESKTEFTITYQVTDAYKKTSYKNVTLVVWDEDAAIAEMPRYYVRYISEKYLDTLEKNSAWRKPENLAYLKNILNNETPMETWEFSHEDIAEIQNWITENGSGGWKIGQEANQAFLQDFAHCQKQ